MRNPRAGRVHRERLDGYTYCGRPITRTVSHTMERPTLLAWKLEQVTCQQCRATWETCENPPDSM